jgi:hypothetical protein
MEAYDGDSSSSAGLEYSITSLASYNSSGPTSRPVPRDGFLIGSMNGTVVTNMLMQRYVDHYFVMGVRAEDLGLNSTQTQLNVSSTSDIFYVMCTLFNKYKNFYYLNTSSSGQASLGHGT